ncbi:MAG: hypothetical protein Q8P02_00105 [Candidatus Micrarchaeota archaeon]|nr:hypothetical protein [Candidatus Micrarchaeota archaeon]
MKPVRRLLQSIQSGLEFLQRQHARSVGDLDAFTSQVHGPIRIQAGWTMQDAYRRSAFVHLTARAQKPGRFNPFLSHEHFKRQSGT